MILLGIAPYSVNTCRLSNKDSCLYHPELISIEQEISNYKKNMLNGATDNMLEKYIYLRNRQDMLKTLISVSEYHDLRIGTEFINENLNEEMKKLLSKLAKEIDKIDISNLDWTSYVKAAVNFTSAQSYGSNIEQVYKRKKGYEKVNPSEEKGDARDKETGKYIEVKFTVLAFPSFQYDVVQIRPHHKIDEYHIIAFNKQLNTTELYVLSKHEMNQEISKTGSSLAHGTNKSKASLVNPEYAIRFKVGSEIHKRWQKFRKPVDWT